MQKTLLIIDDDERIQNLLTDYFNRNSFSTRSAFTGPEGINILTSDKANVDMIILDLMLPEMDGFETLRKIREICDIPVIMLTARDDETDRIVGLEMGADDYLHKPFNPRELLARIKVVLRRIDKQEMIVDSDSEEIRSMEFIINPLSRRVFLKDIEIYLSTVEFDILYALISSKGQVITRDRLMTLARGRDFEAFDRSIDVHISRISCRCGRFVRQKRRQNLAAH